MQAWKKVQVQVQVQVKEEFLYDLLRNPKSYNATMPQQKKTTFPENVFPILEKLNDQKIIVACSGWSDSMVLLDLLREKREKRKEKNGGSIKNAPLSRGVKNENESGGFSGQIIVVHVHHGLRDSADRDEKIVRDYCKKHALEFEVLHTDIKKEAKKTKTTIEECARNIRKAWLEEIRMKHDANYILTAHHADDQTETILYRLVKWTNITGLAWIQELSGVYFRPLLWVKKKDILAYAKKNKIPFGHDETNDDTSIPRNLIRHEVIPRLETINPEAGNALARLSKNAQDLKSGFDEFFKKELESCPPSPWDVSAGVLTKEEGGRKVMIKFGGLGKRGASRKNEERGVL